MTTPIIPEETQDIKEVRVQISDVDLIRNAFGPEWNAESSSDDARSRLGVIGRGVLQKELPTLLGMSVIVSRHAFPLRFTHPDDVGVRKIRLSIAQLLENDNSLHESMVKISAISTVPRDLADELVEESLDEVMKDPTNPNYDGYPDIALLRFLVRSRQGKLNSIHPGFYAVLPMEALHLSIWIDKYAETDLVPYQQVGPWKVEWTRTAMLELMLTIPKEHWGMAFKHAVAFDPSVALTVLKNSIWPEKWQPSKKEVLPILVCNDTTVRTEAIQLVNKLLQGSEVMPEGEGSGTAPIGQKRRVPQKIGY